MSPDPDRPHRYDQYCPVSRALEVVGDRWTLLVVVELLFMPKRFTDLQAALTGVSTNLLSERLKRLQRNGVVRKRRLPPPAAATVYELTAHGRLLEPVAYALGRFGLHHLEPPTEDLSLDLETWLFGVRLTLVPASAAGVKESYQLAIDGRHEIAVEVRDGCVEAAPGRAEAPAVVIATRTPVLLALCARQLSPARALAMGAVELDGDRTAFERFVALFEMPVPKPGARREARSPKPGRSAGRSGGLSPP